MPGRKRLLDLFCGAGGAAVGYHRAGFDIIGVDINDQPNYPFEFVRMDAMAVLREFGCRAPGCLHQVDVVHASPPCQAYSAGKNMWSGRLPDNRHPDLVAPVRELLRSIGLPYVIENVEGAPVEGVTLCGDMFGLGVKRHRLFETSWFIWNPPVCRADHPNMYVSVFGGGALSRTPKGGSSHNFMQKRVHVSHEAAKRAMGIDWMNRDELSQAIPPAYTEWIGGQFYGC